MNPSLSITRQGLRFNRVLFSDHPVATFALKSDALAFSRSKGWLVKDVHQAYNRFSSFWVIGQLYTTELFRVVMKDGSTWDLPLGETPS